MSEITLSLAPSFGTLDDLLTVAAAAVDRANAAALSLEACNKMQQDAQEFYDATIEWVSQTRAAALAEAANMISGRLSKGSSVNE